MTIEISKEDCQGMRVDRSGSGNDHGRQGFYVYVGSVVIHFEDESDAEQLCRMIARRNGVIFDGHDS